MDRAQLIEQAGRFVDAFNRNDLDAVMEFFAADAFYDEFNGRRNVGKAAIRAAFEPQFNGAFGRMRFLDEDLFVDADSGKVMASWRCTLTVKGQATSWRGLDLLHFADGNLVAKLTYAKAKVPLFQD
ncbi:MAG TPA: nuclear transport factor 2 family protein [Candidatus Binataceae bacterium]|nr:nuclear transport factor 2 family protein [Candidatus Binataceae bacterium]